LCRAAVAGLCITIVASFVRIECAVAAQVDASSLCVTIVVLLYDTVARATVAVLVVAVVTGFV
jgi:hypothetical protein